VDETRVLLCLGNTGGGDLGRRSFDECFKQNTTAPRRAVETVERQDTQTELDPLRDLQHTRIAEKRGYVQERPG